MSDGSTSYHEASHSVVAHYFGLPTVYLTVRTAEGEAGRTRFDTHSEGFAKLDDFSCAIIKVAGEIGARIAAGATTSSEARFNWFSEGGDAEDARYFIAQVDGDEHDKRALAQLRAYALLRTRWAAVEEIAGLFQRNKTVLGEEVSKICLAEAARRSARLAAAKPPQPARPDRVPKPLKKPRRPSSGGREVRPFTIGIVGDRAGNDERSKRDEEDSERLHRLNIGRTTPRAHRPNDQFGRSVGDDSQPGLSPIR
jgi:hypothetical protein